MSADLPWWWHAAMSSRRIAALHHVPIIYSSITGRWRCELSGQQWQNGQLQAVNVTPASRSFSSQVKKRKLDNQMGIAKADGGCKANVLWQMEVFIAFRPGPPVDEGHQVIRWIHGVVEWDMPPKKPFSQGKWWYHFHFTREFQGTLVSDRPMLVKV